MKLKIADLVVFAIGFTMTAGLIIVAYAHGAPLYDQRPVMQTPWRMGDWATCLDGTQTYSRNPQYPLEPPAERPCAGHGGIRSFGPGKRLNER